MGPPTRIAHKTFLGNPSIGLGVLGGPFSQNNISGQVYRMHRKDDLVAFLEPCSCKKNNVLQLLEFIFSLLNSSENNLRNK
jgi:hypothetical protein